MTRKMLVIEEYGAALPGGGGGGGGLPLSVQLLRRLQGRVQDFMIAVPNFP